MIRERGIVVRLEGDRLLVQVSGAKGCASCAQKSGCGTGLLERWLNPVRELWLDRDTDFARSLREGQEVDLAVEEGAFVRSALWLYLGPLVCFVAGAGVGLAAGGELASIAGGIAGLIGGSWGVSRFLSRSSFARRFSPQLLDIEHAVDASRGETAKES